MSHITVTMAIDAKKNKIISCSNVLDDDWKNNIMIFFLNIAQLHTRSQKNKLNIALICNNCRSFAEGNLLFSANNWVAVRRLYLVWWT